MNERVASIAAAQLPSGAFPSFRSRGGTTSLDENGFVTALVALELLPFVHLEAARAAVERATGFLERCGSGGVFAFYPRGAAPPAIGDLPPDADDTAIVISLFLRTGRWPLSRALEVIDGALEKYRLHHRPESSPHWVRAGAYRTWLDGREPANPVDCCVNANVAALLRLAGRVDGGYAAAWGTVACAAEWLAESPDLFALASPYYAQAGELHDAVRRAVACGVVELAETLASLDARSMRNGDGDTPLFRSADGAFLWSAPLLHAARRLRPFAQTIEKESS